ncbi:MAG: LamG-like jellyroll fold domain-containing protein, partial [Pirellulaceae bacterium]
AAPGTPHRSRTDLDDVYGVYGHEGRLRGMDGWNPLMSTILPGLPHTAAGQRFVAEAEASAEALRRRAANGEELPPVAEKLLEKLTAAVEAADGAAHPNGGGWVAAGAEVAPTAYVGPNAIVLDNAKVLDQAIVEDCAVIKDNVVLSGHARVGGQAVISKDTKLSGYQRAWMPLALTGEETASDLTLRLDEQLDENGLWANYAMDQAETVMLEDYYRQHGHGDFREFFVSLMNGYLHGQPSFVEEDGRRGFAFDGRAQYAELNRRIADLPEITVDMTVKRQGEGEQTLLDFGSGLPDRFALTTGGPGGKLQFTALVEGGEVARVTSNQPLPKNTWTRVRLEIDGRRVALWMNDKLVGETESEFRPADVFPPGQPQRNFLATARDGKSRLKGVFDNVVVYHQVHGEAFADLPAPHRDAPRRPEKGFAKSVLRNMGASPFEQADRAQRYSEAALHDWHYRAGRAITHLMELKFQEPEYMEAVEDFKEFEQWKKETSEKYRQEFLAANKGSDEEARRYADEKLREAGVIEKEQAVNDRLEKVHDLIREKYYLDYHILCSFIRQNFHGFYNSRISSFINSHAQKLAGGDTLRDDLNKVSEIEDAYAPENWKTSVRQWDWSTKWEKDGSIKDLPLTQKWLKRVRGTAPLPEPPDDALAADVPVDALEPAQQVKVLEARLARLEQVEEQARAAVAAMPESKAAQAEIARLQEEMKPLEEMAKTRLNELRQAEATDPRMLAWKRAEAHIPYSKEWKRVIRALGEARGRVRPAYQHKMRAELKERDPQFKKWSDLSDRVEELQREQLYRLHDYLLRQTDHPRLLPQNRWDRGELDEVRRSLDSAKRALEEARSGA